MSGNGLLTLAVPNDFPFSSAAVAIMTRYPFHGCSTRHQSPRAETPRFEIRYSKCEVRTFRTSHLRDFSRCGRRTVIPVIFV